MYEEGEMIATRTAYGKKLARLGEENEDIVVLDADLSGSTRTKYFRRKFPERFFNCGIAEANMMSIASGLGLSGKIAFASTFAVFASERAFDQVRMGAAYSHSDVKICASHSGVTVGADGASHHALEDIALMRSLPEMRVMVPADANDTERVVQKVSEDYGPYYVRLTRPKVPVLPEHEFRFGENALMKGGEDVTILATGLMVGKALKAADKLEEENISTRVLNVHSIKPLETRSILKAAKETGRIVTAEDHSIIGGLGAAVAEHLGENYPTPIARVGSRDTFGISGGPEELLEEFGMNTKHIVKKAKELIK